MKKNITFAFVDSILSKWLYEKLTNEPPQSPYTKELLNGVKELMAGQTSSIMLGTTQDESFFQNTMDDGIYIGEMEIKLKSRKVLLKGSEVSLTPKEFDVLYFLAKNQGEVFTKEQIYQAVWEEDFLLADSNIMAFIRKIRKKIEPNPDAPEYILTIWGVGYKFNDRL